MSAKLVADRECCVVSATDPHGRILGFLDRSRYYFFQVTPHLYSRGWVDPVRDPLLLRISGRAGNRTRDLWICIQELWPLDNRGGVFKKQLNVKELITTRKWKGMERGWSGFQYKWERLVLREGVKRNREMFWNWKEIRFLTLSPCN
jgi:hypothetical protein